MCGIAGVAPARPCRVEELRRRLQAMTDSIVHRGPDEEGHFVTPLAALGSRRLSVIDLGGGRMPIANESRTVLVVYNGEIYNYRELQVGLRARGHVLRTATDTEVLVHLYEDYGIDFVSRLEGMFAFALWDTERETLFLARDQLGVKPLYYRHSRDGLSFGSELKTLLADERTSGSLDLEAVAEYLALKYVRTPRTIFPECRKLPPGSVLEYHHGVARIRRYWEFPREPIRLPANVGQAVDQLDELLQDSVRRMLVADVPLGAFLSGGVDSSTVVAMAARQAGGRLATFTAGFEGDDQFAAARVVARRYDTDHHELVVHPDDCRMLDLLLDLFDEPFGDSSAIPTYWISALARRHVTVALSGDGGDELFGGYSQYRFDARWAWIEHVPWLLRRAVFGGAVSLLPPGTVGRERLRALASSREERFTRYVARELDPRQGGLLRLEHFRELAHGGALFAGEFAAAQALAPAAQLMYVDAVTYLPDDILTKVDRMSMAHSLEARVPLLTHRVAEFAAALPVEWRMRRGVQKWILKEVARRYLPESLLARPKRGFNLPVAQWLNGPMRDLVDQLLTPDAASAIYVHTPSVRRLVEEHRARRRNHASVLWRLVMFENWLRRWSRSPRVAGRPIASDVVSAR